MYIKYIYILIEPQTWLVNNIITETNVLEQMKIKIIINETRDKFKLYND